MIRPFAVLLVMAMAIAMASPGANADPTTGSAFRLPGDYAEATSLADLQARFGAANVVIVESPEVDGSLRRSAVLFPDDPSRRAYAEFHDRETMTGLASLSVRDAGSRWQGKRGVQVGMSFADLKRANDWPFSFWGFDSGHFGWARDQWSPARGDEDRLGALDVSEGEHMYFGVELGLRAPAQDIPAGDYPHEDSVASDDPRYPRLGEIVVVTAIVASTSLDDEWQ